MAVLTRSTLLLLTAAKTVLKVKGANNSGTRPAARIRQGWVLVTYRLTSMTQTTNKPNHAGKTTIFLTQENADDSEVLELSGILLEVGGIAIRIECDRQWG